MSNDPLNPDDDTIPVLENPLSLDELETADELETPDELKTPGEQPTPEAATRLLEAPNQALLAALLQTPAVQDRLNELSQDLQKLVSAKLQALLEEQLPRLIKQATEESAPRLAEDIRTQMQQALPGLLSQLVRRAQPLDRQD